MNNEISNDRLPEYKLLRFSSIGAIANPEEVQAMARELLALRAERGSEVYQERRYQFIGKRQLEYWADIEKSSYQYLPESERRIIYVLDQ